MRQLHRIGVVIVFLGFLGSGSFGADEDDDPIGEDLGGRVLGNRDSQVGPLPIKNGNLTIFDNWLLNPFNFSRNSESIIDDTGGNDECLMRPERRRCVRRFRRWYFNPTRNRCMRFNSCRGNGNNFRTKERCEVTCSDVGSGGDDREFETDRRRQRNGRRRWSYPRRRYPRPSNYDNYDSESDED